MCRPDLHGVLGEAVEAAQFGAIRLAFQCSGFDERDGVWAAAHGAVGSAFRELPTSVEVDKLTRADAFLAVSPCWKDRSVGHADNNALAWRYFARLK